MSHSYVRKAARTLLESLDITYHESVNRALEADEPLWCTAMFSILNREEVTYCRDKEETGIVHVVVSGQPGRGDEAIIEAAEKIIEAAVGWEDPNGRLLFSDGGAVDDNTVGGYYTYSVSLQYDFR